MRFPFSLVPSRGAEGTFTALRTSPRLFGHHGGHSQGGGSSGFGIWGSDPHAHPPRELRKWSICSATATPAGADGPSPQLPHARRRCLLVLTSQASLAACLPVSPVSVLLAFFFYPPFKNWICLIEFGVVYRIWIQAFCCVCDSQVLPARLCLLFSLTDDDGSWRAKVFGIDNATLSVSSAGCAFGVGSKKSLPEPRS